VTFSTDRLPSTVGSLAEAYQACERLTRSHYENFPVASLWLPRPLRTSISAVYAFSRCADDFADELGLEQADRLARLADWRRRLFAMTRDHETPSGVLGLVRRTLARHGLPLDPFDRLVTAFEMDVNNNRHSRLGRSLCFIVAIPPTLWGNWFLRLVRDYGRPNGAFGRTRSARPSSSPIFGKT
jgi:hypothetical protein